MPRLSAGNHRFLQATILRLNNKITVLTTFILPNLDSSHLGMAFEAKKWKFWSKIILTEEGADGLRYSAVEKIKAE